jgi:hypothetical protein
MTPAKTREQLFNDYLLELSVARETALRRQEGRLRTWTKRLGSEARAREKLETQAPPCTDTRVIFVLRKYWLACDALNREHPATAIDPREFLLGWLRAAQPDLTPFLEPLPYWPMGKDENGNWI